MNSLVQKGIVIFNKQRQNKYPQDIFEIEFITSNDKFPSTLHIMTVIFGVVGFIFRLIIKIKKRKYLVTGSEDFLLKS
jgi:hypothetical protein